MILGPRYRCPTTGTISGGIEGEVSISAATVFGRLAAALKAGLLERRSVTNHGPYTVISFLSQDFSVVQLLTFVRRRSR